MHVDEGVGGDESVDKGGSKGKDRAGGSLAEVSLGDIEEVTERVVKAMPCDGENDRDIAAMTLAIELGERFVLRNCGLSPGMGEMMAKYPGSGSGGSSREKVSDGPTDTIAASDIDSARPVTSIQTTSQSVDAFFSKIRASVQGQSAQDIIELIRQKTDELDSELKGLRVCFGVDASPANSSASEAEKPSQTASGSTGGGDASGTSAA